MRTQEQRERTGWRWFVSLVLIGSLVFGAMLTALLKVDVSPRILALYLAHRSEGHSSLITAPVNKITSLLQWLDRGPELAAALEYPAWAGAQKSIRLETPLAKFLVDRPEALQAALDAAQPGDRIEFLPGVYRFHGKSINVRRGGAEGAPITLAAHQLGEVTLEFDMLEGFNVSAPFWHFENLIMRGVCENDAYCEHAFHIVGSAHGVKIRNNRIEDFNAQIKINGEKGRFPDNGVIEGNSLTASHARRTNKPVTPIDLVGASNWQIRRNLIADFIKRGGDQTSYGGFAKGSGQNNRFESNLVLCEYRLRGEPGRRIGLSLGGGGTGASVCRDRRCITEQEGGALHGNVLAFCSDAGFYLNRAANSQVIHNTLLDTAGIDLRGVETSGRFAGNLLDGGIRVTDGATLESANNRIAGRLAAYFGYHPIRALFRDAASLDLIWADVPPTGGVAQPGEIDFCGQPRPVSPHLGAFENFANCL
ncbi:MAG: right-handed parallel beta-helix repeat-containing protein [Azonexus sp.]|uniref:right-handed parallel beta-helix repeat-containing protein n=1 Tax=Azonexus sp. TaxID=1872668 RepID=UPI0028208B3E|nr:right-handed parallel beta-helix repeat-containing protein [Azonexus sp.]MDR0777415.1 right-handed parallel beta-helix repeat-containing protein [Azonexus sp.]